jgi:cell cycle protein gpsB
LTKLDRYFIIKIEVIEMHQDKIALTMQDILEKEFKVDTRGYRMQEVDQFLDVIIKDYNEYNNMIKELKKENEKLEEENTSLKQEMRSLKSSIETVKGGEKEITNVDLLRRISQLEKIVLGKEE